MNNAHAENETLCDGLALSQFKELQPHGYLFILDDDLKITHCSENVAPRLSQSLAEVLGAGLQDIFTSSDCEVISHILRDRVYFDYYLLPHSRLWCRCHKNGNQTLIELEHYKEGEDSGLAPDLFLRLSHRLDNQTTLGNLANETCLHIKQYFKYDHVMIYRFFSDYSGQVVGESKEPDAQSYLNLCFPNTDVPLNVRRYFELNSFRHIPNIADQPAAIHALDDEQSNKLDLTFAVLRQVAPVHLQYLSNMGTQAVLSMAITVNDQFWGILTCHSNTPRYTTVSERKYLEALLKLLEKNITLLKCSEANDSLRQNQELKDILSEQLGRYEDLFHALKQMTGYLLDLFHSHGFALILEGEIHGFGVVPNNKQVIDLLKWATAESLALPYAANRIEDAFASSDRLDHDITGYLIIKIAKDQHNYLIFFRQEQVREVFWAGDPHHAVQWRGNQYSPRASFERWRQEVRAISREWSEWDIQLASLLQHIVVEKMLHDKLQRQAIEDPLTGTYNRRYLDIFLNQKINRALREEYQIGLLLIDIDHFKVVNDKYGHIMGDIVLKQLVNHITDRIRSYEELFRYGGEEFLLLFNNITLDQAYQRAEELRESIERMTVEQRGVKITLTVSIGISVYPIHGTDKDELLQLADKMLYRAKETGRNRVVYPE